MNSIAQKQNTTRQISRLAAQRTLYSRAKDLLAIQMMLTIPLAGAWSIVANLEPSLRIWATLWGLSVALLDASVLDYFQSRFKEAAAKIQEQFDCEILGLPWNEFRSGPQPDPELVVTASKNAQNLSALKDWYSPAVSALPLHAARVVCQRSNLWWDKQLRHFYSLSVLALTLLMFLAALCTGIATHLTLEKFVLAVLAPLSPMLLWFIKEYRRQETAIASLERLKSHLEQVWNRLLVGELADAEALREARSVQDEIYERRKHSPLIFDWVYRTGRNRQDNAMNVAAEELVRLYGERRSGAGPT